MFKRSSHCTLSQTKRPFVSSSGPSHTAASICSIFYFFSKAVMYSCCSMDLGINETRQRKKKLICNIMARMFLCDSVNRRHSFIHLFSDFAGVKQS